MSPQRPPTRAARTFVLDAELSAVEAAKGEEGCQVSEPVTYMYVRKLNLTLKNWLIGDFVGISISHVLSHLYDTTTSGVFAERNCSILPATALVLYLLGASSPREANCQCVILREKLDS